MKRLLDAATAMNVAYATEAEPQGTRELQQARVEALESEAATQRANKEAQWLRVHSLEVQLAELNARLSGFETQDRLKDKLIVELKRQNVERRRGVAVLTADNTVLRWS